MTASTAPRLRAFFAAWSLQIGQAGEPRTYSLSSIAVNGERVSSRPRNQDKDVERQLKRAEAAPGWVVEFPFGHWGRIRCGGDETGHCPLVVSGSPRGSGHFKQLRTQTREMPARLRPRNVKRGGRDGPFGSGGFPVHVAEIGKGVKVWRWSDVQPRLVQKAIAEQDTPLPRRVIVEANWLLVRQQETQPGGVAVR